MKYILQYTGPGKATPGRIMEVLTSNRARIIDDSDFPEMALIELSPGDVNAFNTQTGRDWNLSEYKPRFAHVPTTRKKLRR